MTTKTNDEPLRFSEKLGYGLGDAAPNFLLSFFGFIANQEQTPTSLAGIRFMFSVFPAICAVLSAVAIAMYRLDDDQVKQIEADLADRHGARLPLRGAQPPEPNAAMK